MLSGETNDIFRCEKTNYKIKAQQSCYTAVKRYILMSTTVCNFAVIASHYGSIKLAGKLDKNLIKEKILKTCSLTLATQARDQNCIL